MTTIAEFKKGDEILRIVQDENPLSPREWDNLGKMVCFHNRYKLGDTTELTSGQFGDWNELVEHLKKEKGAMIILPLYLYDHSGLRIKVGSFQGFLPQGHAEFDSGQVGFIYATKEDLKKEGIGKAKALAILKSEVETYDQYLSGQVYGYEIVKVKKCKECGTVQEEAIDACWGFFGDEIQENGILDSIDKKWKGVMLK
jgi:hypothetical protein